ncbi:MAG: TRAP transporter small permease [Verrucomicrobia bacterium]|nr:TRAP transporter small permease [Verrucomicrobiota bacterium]
MSGHGAFEDAASTLPGGAPERPLVPRPTSRNWLDWALYGINRGVVIVSMLALVAASLVLSYSVVVRYFFHAPTDWQDEVAVFLLVGATFLCGAMVQANRGHVGIGALEAVLSPRANSLRLFFVDCVSALFCAFFAWKSWTLCAEAWREGQTTSSTWAPPLWIPYSLMATGMSLLVLQLGCQVWLRVSGSFSKSTTA